MLDIHNMEDIDRILLEEAALGKDAEEFVASPMGRYLVGCVRQEYMEAIEELGSIAFFKIWRIIQLQNKVWRCRRFLEWFGEMIETGNAAAITLTRRHEDNESIAE